MVIISAPHSTRWQHAMGLSHHLCIIGLNPTHHLPSNALMLICEFSSWNPTKWHSAWRINPTGSTVSLSRMVSGTFHIWTTAQLNYGHMYMLTEMFLWGKGIKIQLNGIFHSHESRHILCYSFSHATVNRYHSFQCFHIVDFKLWSTNMSRWPWKSLQLHAWPFDIHTLGCMNEFDEHTLEVCVACYWKPLCRYTRARHILHFRWTDW